MKIQRISEESDFRYQGCDNCNNQLGNDVYEVIIEDEFDAYVCCECILADWYGEELPEDCQNVFNI